MITAIVKKPLICTAVVNTFSGLFVVISLSSSSSSSFYQIPSPTEKSDIWSVKRIWEWRPCNWWLQGHLTVQTMHLVFCVEMLQLFQRKVMAISEWIVMANEERFM